MLTTTEIVELVREKTDTGSKYAAAKSLGVTTQSLNDWTMRGRTMSDPVGLKAASLLDIDPDYILACLAAERAKGTPTFDTWKHICQRLTPQNRRISA